MGDHRLVSVMTVVTVTGWVAFTMCQAGVVSCHPPKGTLRRYHLLYL